MSRSFVKAQLHARLAGGLFGFLLLWGATLSALFAEAHANALGSICGASASPHCGWCYAAVSLALAGLTACAAALAPWRSVAETNLAIRA